MGDKPFLIKWENFVWLPDMCGLLGNIASNGRSNHELAILEELKFYSFDLNSGFDFFPLESLSSHDYVQPNEYLKLLNVIVCNVEVLRS